MYAETMKEPFFWKNYILDHLIMVEFGGCVLMNRGMFAGDYGI